MAVPEEILAEEILIRLPVKSVVRFRSVCKLWQSLLSDHNFIKFHLTRTSRSPYHDALIFETLIFPNNNSLSRKELTILRRSDYSCRLQHLPFNYPRNSSVTLIGSINGLVCLHFRGLEFILWNPSTRESMTIMPPFVSNFWIVLKKIGRRGGYIHRLVFHGFGWDALENEYKVLVCFINENRRKCMMVYSSKINGWTKLVMPPVQYTWCPERVTTPTTIVKGCPYWSYNSGGNNEFNVVKFEVSTNEFRVLPQVDRAMFGGTIFLPLNWKDSLAGVVYNKLSSRMELYCLNEEGSGVWSKMFAFNLDFRKWEYDFPVYSFKYGAEIVLNRNKHVYDPKTDQLRCIHFAYHGALVHNGFSYTDSLVYVNGMKPLQLQSLWRSLASLLIPRCMKNVRFDSVCGLLIVGTWSMICSRHIDLDMRNKRKIMLKGINQ